MILLSRAQINFIRSVEKNYFQLGENKKIVEKKSLKIFSSLVGNYSLFTVRVSIRSVSNSLITNTFDEKTVNVLTNF